MKSKVLGILSFGLGMLTLGLMTFSAHAQSVPVLGTSDIADANGPVWTALIDILKYYISTYGVLMLWIFGIIAVFLLAIGLWKYFFH